jgi:hypothetical protein
LPFKFNLQRYTVEPESEEQDDEVGLFKLNLS